MKYSVFVALALALATNARPFGGHHHGGFGGGNNGGNNGGVRTYPSSCTHQNLFFPL